MTKERIGKMLKCHNCKHIWIYTGKNKYYGQCTMCMYKVNIKKHTITL